MKPILEVRNIWKSYKIGGTEERYLSLRDSLSGMFRRKPPKEAFWALQDVSFDVYEGDSIGIIGRNGAGKSTLLKILSKITPPTKGQIIARGRVASLLEVGTGFHPELTGRENIYLNGAILGLGRQEINRKFDEIVDFSGVDKFLDTPLKHYSSGMQLRLAFSVAAHLEPEILLIDEVLAVGDAEFQKKCLGKMDEVSKSGRTVVFVSHNLSSMKSLCPKSILLIDGSVKVIGETTAVIDSYQKTINSLPQTGNFQINGKKLGGLSVSEIRVLKEEKACHAFPMGEPISFEIDFESDSPTNNVVIGYVIQSQYGALLNANNLYQKSIASKSALKSGTIRCALGCAPLMPGHYFVSFWIGINEQKLQVFRDKVYFQVEEKNIWGTAHNPPAITPMWWDTKFSIHPNRPVV